MQGKAAHIGGKKNVAATVAHQGVAPQPSRPDRRDLDGWLLNLQRTRGNRFVQRFLNGGVLQRTCACGASGGSNGKCGGCQKQDAEMQRSSKGGVEASTVPRIVHEAMRSSGQPLHAATRDLMQTRLSSDFSQVQVHTDQKASKSAEAVNARAYTVGRDIFFGANRYQPHSREGRRLIAHELTHVIQQGGESESLQQSLTLGEPADAYEQEADKVAAEVTQLEVSAPAAESQPAHITSGSADAGIHNTASSKVVQRDVVGAGAGGVIGAIVGGVAGGLIGGGVGAAVGIGVGALGGALIGHAVTGSGKPAAGGALPTVTLGNFRNSGTTSPDNECPNCLVNNQLGLDAFPEGARNRMELRGDITGHVAAAQYDIKRTKERGTWKNVGGTWTQESYIAPGTDDDTGNDDEDLSPHNDHIYSVDSPGFHDITDPVGDATATEAVYKASFIESVNVINGAGGWTKSSNDFEWHSITWLENVAGTWQRKAGANEVEPGATTVGTGDP